VNLKLWVVENRPSPLLWPVAYTTACTTVQAVISLPVHIAVTCHDPITTANLLPCTHCCHLSRYYKQFLALYTALWPVMIPLLLPISRNVHSAVTCNDPITTANLLPCTQRCQLSWSDCQSLALYTALSPVMIPLPICCSVHSAITCHDPVTTANLLQYTQCCHLSWSQCQSLALYTALSLVIIPLLLPISCPIHRAVTCHAQRCHLLWSHYYCQSLALCTLLSPVTII